MSLGPEVVARLRAHYGSAYATHALDDLHANSVRSPAIALLGIDVGSRGAWGTAAALVGEEIEQNTNSIKRALGNMAKRENGWAPLFVAMADGALRFTVDSFSTLIAEFVERAWTEGLKPALAELLRLWKALCEFLSRVFTGADEPEAAAATTELEGQANTYWDYLKAPLESLRWLWEAASSILGWLGSGLQWCVAGAKQLMGTLMQNLSRNAPGKALKRTAYTMIYLGYCFTMDLASLVKEQRERVEALVHSYTSKWPPLLLQVAEQLQFVAHLAVAPVAALLSTTLGKALVGFALDTLVAGAVVGVRAVAKILSYVGGWIRWSLGWGWSAALQLLPSVVMDNITLFGSAVMDLAASVKDALTPTGANGPDFLSVTGFAQDLECCEALL